MYLSLGYYVLLILRLGHVFVINQGGLLVCFLCLLQSNAACVTSIWLLILATITRAIAARTQIRGVKFKSGQTPNSFYNLSLSHTYDNEPRCLCLPGKSAMMTFLPLDSVWWAYLHTTDPLKVMKRDSRYSLMSCDGKDRNARIRINLITRSLTLPWRKVVPTGTHLMFMVIVRTYWASGQWDMLNTCARFWLCCVLPMCS